MLECSFIRKRLAQTHLAKPQDLAVYLGYKATTSACSPTFAHVSPWAVGKPEIIHELHKHQRTLEPRNRCNVHSRVGTTVYRTGHSFQSSIWTKLSALRDRHRVRLDFVHLSYVADSLGNLPRSLEG